MIIYDLGNVADWLSSIGTVGAVMVALFLAKKEYNNQLKIKNKEQLLKEKSAFLTLLDELEENTMVLKNYLTCIEDGVLTPVDTKDIKNAFFSDNIMNEPKDQAWKEVRGIVFLSENKSLIKELSGFYKNIYGLLSSNIITYKSTKAILDKCTAVMLLINNHISQLI